MKKWIACALWLLLACAAALAEGIELDEGAVFGGMERSWAQGYAPSVSEGFVSLCLPLSAPTARGKLRATLEMDDPAATPFRDQQMWVSVARNEEKIFPVKLRLRLLSDYVSGDYPCRVKVEGSDGEGEPLSWELPLLLRVRGGRARAGLHPMIGEAEAALEAGETATLTAVLRNPYPDVAFEDVLLTLADEKGEVKRLDSEVAQVGDLAPGQETRIELPLAVLPAASVGLHTLKLSLDYTALDEAGSWSQSFNLPVTQALRLEQGGIQMASGALQGDSATLTLPLMNLGRGELRNVCASLTLPGLVQRQSVLVGTLPSGESKQAKLSWSVPGNAEPGRYAGTLEVSGEDEWGNATGFELPVSLDVEAKPPAAGAENGAAAAAASGVDRRWLYVLGGGCALLLLALVVQGAALRARLRKLEEGRL